MSAALIRTAQSILAGEPIGLSWHPVLSLHDEPERIDKPDDKKIKSFIRLAILFGSQREALLKINKRTSETRRTHKLCVHVTERSQYAALFKSLYSRQLRVAQFRCVSE